MPVTRRRFLAISACAAALPAAVAARPLPGRSWIGQALGARASIRLDHPQAQAITARCLAEIDRLEAILSLYRADSALSRLNREGRLPAPPFELLECLSLAGAVHRGSGGLFDVTMQPLWDLWARAAANGERPPKDQRRAALGRTGWSRVRLSPDEITLDPGMAITLNGIGQGYVADRVAALLVAEGLDNILIDCGELRALGPQPQGDPWPVRLEGDGRALPLSGRALATSAPRGTCFDPAGRDGHILDPRSGAPAMSRWRSVSVSAPDAALADAISTAACLADDPAALLTAFPTARLKSAV